MGNAEKLPKACWELFPPGVKESCGIYTHLLGSPCLKAAKPAFEKALWQ